MKLLNIACGDRYHLDWVNIDFHSEADVVKKVNILNGLPFKDESFDVVYSSHFIEHLSSPQADFVIQEARRILKKNGILRIVVPDLENICKEYINILDKTVDDKSANERYNWIVIELLDQLTRVNGGGLMLQFFDKIKLEKDIALSKYIFDRIGYKINFEKTSNNKKITFNRVKNKILYLYLQSIRLLIPSKLRDMVFINTPIGERHQWMYDKYSMSILLERLGFVSIKIKAFNTSEIDDFNSYNLDIESSEIPYKGVSSLYIEARK